MKVECRVEGFNIRQEARAFWEWEEGGGRGYVQSSSLAPCPVSTFSAWRWRRALLCLGCAWCLTGGTAGKMAVVKDTQSPVSCYIYSLWLTLWVAFGFRTSNATSGTESNLKEGVLYIEKSWSLATGCRPEAAFTLLALVNPSEIDWHKPDTHTFPHPPATWSIQYIVFACPFQCFLAKRLFCISTCRITVFICFNYRL